MAHILILKASSNENITQAMSRRVIEVITSQGHTYDEIVIPSTKELPIALNLFAEALNYEAAICIGVLDATKTITLNEIHAQEILRTLYEYSTYYALPIGIAITYFKTSEEINSEEAHIKATEFAQDIANNIIDMMKTIRQLNSLESEKYAQYRKHN